jgi:hypothetical protein
MKIIIWKKKSWRIFHETNCICINGMYDSWSKKSNNWNNSCKKNKHEKKINMKKINMKKINMKKK